jgi:hypothetical protein
MLGERVRSGTRERQAAWARGSGTIGLKYCGAHAHTHTLTLTHAHAQTRLNEAVLVMKLLSLCQFSPKTTFAFASRTISRTWQRASSDQWVSAQRRGAVSG